MKIRIWPNKLGVDVTQGRLRLEVWHHGGCTRLVPDNSITGYRGTHWLKLETMAPLEQLAAAAVDAWKNRRSEWRECE